MEDETSRWEVEEDEFGRPLVRHRHVTGTVDAYVSKDAYGSRKAWCPTCNEQMVLDEKRGG